MIGTRAVEPLGGGARFGMRGVRQDRAEAGETSRQGRRAHRFCAALIAVLAIASAAPARAQYFGQNKVQYRSYDWRSIRSDHFQVYYYPELDSLAKRVLDLAEKTDR